MNRRRFLNKAGIWVPVAVAFPAIVRAQRSLFTDPGFLGVLTRRTAPPAACSTLRDTQTGTISNDVDPGRTAAWTYASTSFVPTASYTICKVVLNLRKTGSPTYHLKAGIYSNTGSFVNDYPNALIGTASDDFLVSVLTTSNADYDFVNMSASVTSGTEYHLVVWATDSPSDNTNYARANYAALAGKKVAISSDGSSWSNYAVNMQLLFKMYS